MYEIEFTPDATKDLHYLRKNEQREVLTGVEQLRYEPTTPTRNRKRLEPNDLAEWELRVGKYRVLYNVFEEVLIVSIESVGIKLGNIFAARGKEKKL